MVSGLSNAIPASRSKPFAEQRQQPAGLASVKTCGRNVDAEKEIYLIILPAKGRACSVLLMG